MFVRALFSLACVALAACAVTPDVSMSANGDKNWLWDCKNVTGGVTREYYEQLNITKMFDFNQKSLTILIPKRAPSNNAYLVGLLVKTCSAFGTKYTVQLNYYRDSVLPTGNGRLVIEHLNDNTYEFPLTVKVTAFYDAYTLPMKDTSLEYLSNP